MTTGAVDYRFADSPVAESFSSYGGLLSDGSTLEIDIYAPDGGNTSVRTIGQDAQCDTCDKDGILNFYGTSASAPHLAGTAALLMSAAPSWFPDGSGSTDFTADQAIQLFKRTATGFTAADGSPAGFLNTLAAFKNIATQTAKITELRVEDGKIPSAEPFTVTIIGEFFPENPEDLEILFDEQPLENVEIETVEGNTIITATVPTFSGNPALFVVTNGITPGGTDGGKSDPAYFFDDGKLALNIIAKNAQFEYGQDIRPTYYRANPDDLDNDYTPPFIVEGLPEGVTFESLEGLPPVVLNNIAIDEKLAESGYPIVFDYVITPSFGDQAYDEEAYQINFISGFIDPDAGRVGYLTITKKDLTITPHPIGEPENTPFIYTYGDAIDLSLIYSYDDYGILDNSQDVGFYSVIDASHASDFKDGIPNKFKAIVNKFKAIVNDYDLGFLSGGSWSASDRTIENKFKAIVNGMNVIDLDTENFIDYIESREAFDEGETNKFKAIVNKFKAIVNTEDLFVGDVEMGIENKFKAIVNKFKAIVNEEDPERPYRTYQKVFTIIDAEDAPPEDGSDADRAISNIYALNMITGLEVTPEGENHYVYPGAFLNASSANFNITYVPGSLIILPKGLLASTNNLVIPYGTELTKDDLITSFDGWAFEGEFQESEAIVFPEVEGGIPYYFVRVGDPDETPIELNALKDLGDYLIKIRDPQNYVVTHIVDEAFGTLTIEAAPLSFTPIDETIMYGATPVITPNFVGFAVSDDGDPTNDETTTILEVDGKMPYYFIKAGDANKYKIGDRMDVGVYEVFITDDQDDNYIFLPDTKLGNLTITEAPLQFNPIALELEYGETPEFDPIPITGFVNGETSAVLKNEANIIPYYFKKEGDATAVYNIGDKMGVGVHEMFVTDDPNDNYSIENVVGRGQLTIVPAHVTVQIDNVEKEYGIVLMQADLRTNFSEFAYRETVEDVFGSAVLPYYLEDTAGEYEINAIKDVGVYYIRIRETNANYIFDFDGSYNVFEVTEKSLTAIIDNLVINQGETPVFISAFTGFIPGENVANVFPGGIPYYIVDEYGYEADYEEAGPYKIKIKDDRENYSISSNDDATLFINPFNDYMKKIRVYADCVVYNGPKDYTVTYRYENDNGDAIFIPSGPDNKLSGPAAASSSGELPNLFMPGAGTFEIRFNGKKLVWSLTSSGSTNKSSVSSSTTSDSGECDAKLDGAYTVYPNPVTDGNLFIKQNVVEESTVYILNMYGGILDTNNDFNGTNDTITIDMSGYDSGIYVVRIVSPDQVRTYNIIKQ